MNKAEYHRINSSHGDPFVFCLTGRGFFSEVNNLLNAILFGIVKKRRLFVDQSRFAYGSLKWDRLFDSALPLINEEGAIHIEKDWIISNFKSPGFQSICTHLKDWHRRRRFFLSRSYGFYANVFMAKRDLARLFCQPVSQNRYSLQIPKPYAAIHVRRGDKVDGFNWKGRFIVEGEDIPIENYLHTLTTIMPGVKNLFIMTDDYRIVESIRSTDHSYNVFTLCDKDEHGYRQYDFNSNEDLSKADAVKRLIAEVQIACNSKVFAGCFKSNVSRYIALMHQNPRHCYSLDNLKDWNPL
jgi:hypothetical protein